MNLYGITFEEYQEILEGQNGVCAVCKSPPGTKRLNVDHVHTKDKKGKQIRGVKELTRGQLCFFCNKYVVGAIEHRTKVNPRDVLDGIIQYFTKYKMKGE